jgi:hypothetical protein
MHPSPQPLFSIREASIGENKVCERRGVADSSIFNPRGAQLSADHVVGRRRKQPFFFLESGLLSSIRGWRSGAGVGSCVRSIGGTVGVRRAAARRDRTPKRRSIDSGGGQPNEGGDSRESFETPRSSGINRVIAGGKPRMREREESSPRLTRGRAQSSIERQTSPFAPQVVVWIW